MWMGVVDNFDPEDDVPLAALQLTWRRATRAPAVQPFTEYVGTNHNLPANAKPLDYFFLFLPHSFFVMAAKEPPIALQMIKHHELVKITGRKRICHQCDKMGLRTPTDRKVETTFEYSFCKVSLCRVRDCFRNYHADNTVEEHLGDADDNIGDTVGDNDSDTAIFSFEIYFAVLYNVSILVDNIITKMDPWNTKKTSLKHFILLLYSCVHSVSGDNSSMVTFPICDLPVQWILCRWLG